MYYDKKQITDSLTKEHVIKIVTELGSKNHRDGSKGELIFNSICHGSDSQKLYYYHEGKEDSYGKLFHCYSGCGDSFSIFELVIRVNRLKGKTITFYQALAYVAGIVGISGSKTEFHGMEQNVEDWSWIDKFKKKTRKSSSVQLKEYNEHILEIFFPYPHEMFLQDYISRETMSQFEISFFGRDNAIIIPHRDIDGRLVGIRERYVSEEDVKNIGKYVPVIIEGQFIKHSLGSNLYGIYQNQDKIRRCKKVLLLESEKGVMQCHSYFGDDDFSLSVCGNNITSTQIRLLEELGVEEIIIGFDKMYKDSESYQANIYRNKLFKKIAPLLLKYKVSLLWDKGDLLEYKQSPTDYGKDVLLEMLQNKIEITQEDLDLLNEEII